MESSGTPEVKFNTGFDGVEISIASARKALVCEINFAIAGLASSAIATASTSFSGFGSATAAAACNACASITFASGCVHPGATPARLCKSAPSDAGCSNVFVAQPPTKNTVKAIMAHGVADITHMRHVSNPRRLWPCMARPKILKKFFMSGVMAVPSRV